MAGLTDRAASSEAPSAGRTAEAHRAWEAAMLAQVDRVRADLRERDPGEAAQRIGARVLGAVSRWSYWGREVRVDWPALKPTWADNGEPCSPFDTATLLYYLRSSDGTLPAGTWVGYRELPGGSFYHQAFTGYAGQRLASTFGETPDSFHAAAQRLGGEPLGGLAPHAWRFVPLPRIPIAACLWPGDEEVTAQAAVVFDANAGHHLPIDGLALLGAGLTGRLLRAASTEP